MLRCKLKEGKSLPKGKGVEYKEEMLLHPVSISMYYEDPYNTRMDSRILIEENDDYRDINNVMYPRCIIDEYYDIIEE
jgi:hypothetical protein